MKNILYHLLHNPLCTKINSFLIALFLWSALSSWRILEVSKTIPLHLHSTRYLIQQAPPAITITLKGSRAVLKNIDWKNLAAHINIDTLSNPLQPLAITHEHLFLPNTIKLLSSNPSPITVALEKNN